MEQSTATYGDLVKAQIENLKNSVEIIDNLDSGSETNNNHLKSASSSIKDAIAFLESAIEPEEGVVSEGDAA